MGCGTGWFLEVAREHGFNVSGIEFGERLAKATQDRLNIDIFTKPLDQFEKNKLYDVITIFDVIEHVKDPRGLLNSIYDHLNNDGIGVIFTPNVDSFGIQTLKQYSSLVCIDHIFLFNDNSLLTLCNNLGFDVLYSETKGSDIIDIYAYYDQHLKQKEVAKLINQFIKT